LKAERRAQLEEEELTKIPRLLPSRGGRKKKKKKGKEIG